MPYLTNDVPTLSVVQVMVAVDTLVVAVGCDVYAGGDKYLPVGSLETMVDAAEDLPALSTDLIR